MGIAGAAAGAGEGLDTFLNRLMLQQEVDERTRHNQATEALTGRQLDQADEVKKSLAELRDAQTKGLQDKQADVERRNTNRAAMLADPNVPDAVKIALRAYEALPEGDKSFPWQVIQPKEPTKKSLQQHFADIELNDNGINKSLKNVPINYNPDDGSITFNGTRLDPAKVHGITSPTALAAGKQFIQGPDGWYLADKTTNSAAPVGAQGGGNLPLAPTSTTRTMQEGANMLLPHVADIQKQAEALDKEGLFGPAMSRIRQIAEKVGTIDQFYDAVSSDPELKNDERIGRFATSLGLLATGAGRVHGGAKGGGSPQMFEHFKHMLSDTGTYNLFKGRISAVDDFMRGYSQGPNRGQQQPQQDPNDPLGLFSK